MASRHKKQLFLDTKQIRRFEKLEKEISDWIWTNGYDSNTETFQQYPGAPLQDATNFLFVLLQFLDKHDPKTKTVIKKTCEELCVNDVFVYRYLTDDGLTRGEGAFLLCSFWMISAFAILKESDEAKRLFDILQTKIAPSGLLAEEMNAKTGAYLGNYPQAFSHQGYIMSAYYINRYKISWGRLSKQHLQ